MADSLGLVQFENAIAEIARGDSSGVPSVTPVWARELLNARNPPSETCTHREFIPISNTKRTIFPFDPREFVHKSFYFSPEDIAALRSSLPSELKCSTFDVLIACLWRCRTIALEFEPDEEVRTLYFINARSRFNPPLPEGFYGNAIASPPVVSTAGELITNPLSYVVELVRKPKAEVTEEYMKSLADLMVLRGRPRLTLVSTYMVSDLTRIGFDDVDFGWGKPVYAGAARAAAELIPGVATYFSPRVSKEGEKGVVVPVCLPKLAMEKFAKEVASMVKRNI
ncbi:OLC1v1000708C2 [Oldenlandia corymbosa var. corymbosa]|nr:OLC1v1000708C2 [Oldenlandia corymbosa var. corymbosa]